MNDARHGLKAWRGPGGSNRDRWVARVIESWVVNLRRCLVPGSVGICIAWVEFRCLSAGGTFRRSRSSPLVAPRREKFAEKIRGGSVLRDVVDDQDLVEHGLQDLFEVLVGRVRQVGVARLRVGEGDEEAVGEALVQALGA